MLCILDFLLNSFVVGLWCCGVWIGFVIGFVGFSYIREGIIENAETSCILLFWDVISLWILIMPKVRLEVKNM